jgi:hypothetical protein
MAGYVKKVIRGNKNSTFSTRYKINPHIKDNQKLIHTQQDNKVDSV